MKTTNLIAIALAAASITACAPRPDAIAPVGMGNAFAEMNCAQARIDLTAERQTLDSLSASQRSAAAGDAIGVFLIGVPASSLTGGDKSGQIAASKGKIIALEARIQTCQAQGH